jgi:diguanylate cyclase (GGDEF)-like protein/PAS domain S-box-containing protein
MLNLLHLVLSPPEGSLLYTGHYDPVLVLFSIAVAIFASYGSLLASQHVSVCKTATARRLWIVSSSFCLGLGVWSMHFVGMLAFSLPCSSTYNPTITLLSMIPGILASSLALNIISHHKPSSVRLVTGGLLIGIGISAMHYSGMAAMRLNGLIRYDVHLFLLSVFIAIALAILALWIKFRLQSWLANSNWGVMTTSAVLMGLAVSGMHYTAMASAFFIRDGDHVTVTTGIAPTFLASIVLASTCLIVIITIVATYAWKPNMPSLKRPYRLIGGLIIGWMVVAWLSAHYYYTHHVNDLYRRESLLGKQQAENIADNIGENIEMLKGISIMYSRDDDTKRALRRFGKNAVPSSLAYGERKQQWIHDREFSELNNTLGIEAPALGADLIFIINAAGDCVAASNAGKPESPIGKNFADRKYFSYVKAGLPGYQYAVGRTTNVPGLFFAHPTFEARRFLGAVVVKRDVANLVRWTNQTNAFITDANGVIILASDKRLEFRYLPNAAIEKLSAEEILSQYKRNVLEPLRMAPWEEMSFQSVVLIEDGAIPTLISSKHLANNGITVYINRSLEEIYRMESERYWLFILLAAIGSMLIITVSSVMIYLYESHRLSADLRIAASAFETQEGMLITDSNGMILRVNHAFTEITGYTAQEVIGQNPRMLASGRQNAGFYLAMWKTINCTGGWKGEVWNRRKNGEVYPEHLSITAVKDRQGIITNYVAGFADITQRIVAEEKIKTLAFFDPLTLLPNRRLLLDRLAHALAASTSNRYHGALLLIDMDNFKAINDSLGHGIGDLFLQQVAQRLTTCLREGDTIARLGGDEFVVILENLGAESMVAAAQTKHIGEQIIATINRPYLLDSHECNSTASIGATLFNDHQQAVEDLFKQAEISMYQSKKAGRNCLRFFDSQMQDSINVRAALESEFRKALVKREFHLYYQIQVDQYQRIMGAETLIRWIHPKRGFVSPSQFIPLAEETGLILSIGQWVLEAACAQIKTWQRDVVTRDLVLAVNVSAKQFRQADFVDQVLTTVKRYAINPKLLKLELTESMLLDGIEDIIATMKSLQKIGIQFSLDDFGTGYSSLQYLKRLPLNQLKIDQSFVRDIATDSSDRAIVNTIIAMANSLNLNVIAEGVETEEQRKFLMDNGCTQYQGYLFGKPLPIDQFEVLLKRYEESNAP